METPAMSDRWLSVEEIAEYLGVSKDTVYAWISKRNILLTESVDFGSSSLRKSMSGCALVEQQKAKVEAKND